MREKLAAIDIEAIATQGHFRLAPESIDKYLALMAEEVKKLHCTYEICEDFRQKVLELLEGK